MVCRSTEDVLPADLSIDDRAQRHDQFLVEIARLGDTGDLEIPYTEQEIRALLREAHIHGNLTRSEHRLIDAVFEFDDMLCPSHHGSARRDRLHRYQ